jgi:hypothetical protein
MIGWIWNASTREVLTVSDCFGCTIGLLASFALAFRDRPFTLSTCIRFDPVKLKAIYRPVLMAVSSSLYVFRRSRRKNSISVVPTQNF